jgi:hypothetical protein
VIESSFLEIAGAAERNSAGVAEHFPLPLRCLYRERRTAAVNQFGVDKTAVDKIECQCLKTGDFGHVFTEDRKIASYARSCGAASISFAATSSGARCADKR